MAETRTINLEVNDNSEETAKGFKKVADNINEATEATEKLADNLGDANKNTKDLKKSGDAAAGGFKKVGNAVKGLGGAFKALGLGLIISAFLTLKEVFTQNQKVADTLSAVFETISIVFNEVARVVTDVYKSVSEATGGFDALKKVMGGLLTLALTPFKVAFYGIKLGIQEVQLIWEKSMFGDNDPKAIKNLQKEIKQTTEDLKDVGQGAIQATKDIGNNIVEAVGEVGSFVTETAKGISEISVKAAFETAKLNVEITNRAKIAAAQQGLLVEQYDRQAEKLRQVRDEERNSIDERIKANDNLNEVLDKQEKALLAQANLQIQAAQNEKNKSDNIENQVALIEAIANKEGIRAQIEGLRSEQLANDLALSREKLELTQAQLEADTTLSLEQKKFNASVIADALERLEAERVIIEEEKVIELSRLQNKIDSYKLGTQARLDAEIEFNTLKQELDNAAIENEIAQAEEKKARDEKIRDQEIKDAKTLADAKSQAITNGLQTISNLTELFAGQSRKQQEKAFKIQKAVSIAQAGIDTFQSAVAAFKSLAGIPVVGVGLGIAAAAAATTAGLANIKKIASQEFNGGGDKSAASAPSFSASSGGGGAGSSGVITPNFNLVGDNGTNQLNQLNQPPIKTYIVGAEVSTAQGLERNRVRNATL